MTTKIDYDTCSMDDVIRWSITLHRLQFADAMHGVSCVHNRAAETLAYRDSELRRGAIRLRDAAVKVAKAIGGDDSFLADPADWTFAERVLAFNVAARLHGLDLATASHIAARDDR